MRPPYGRSGLVDVDPGGEDGDRPVALDRSTIEDGSELMLNTAKPMTTRAPAMSNVSRDQPEPSGAENDGRLSRYATQPTSREIEVRGWTPLQGHFTKDPAAVK